MDYKFKLLLVACACLFSSFTNAALLNTELVVNGGAETGDTTGWTSNGVFATTGDIYSQGFGAYSFTAGTGAGVQTLSQTIDVNANSIQIDNSEITLDFGVQLQSRSDGVLLDRAIAEVFLKDSIGNSLGSLYFEDTINTGLFDWNFFSGSLLLASGTRSIDILLTGTRNGGSSSDGFFDEVSLKLKNTASVPEPSILMLITLGLAGLSIARRRMTHND